MAPSSRLLTSSSRRLGGGFVRNDNLNSKTYHGDTSTADTAPAFPVYRNGHQAPVAPSSCPLNNPKSILVLDMDMKL